MYKNIIVCLALDHGIAARALKMAKLLSSENAKVTAIHVMEPLHGSVSAFLSEDDSKRAISNVQQQLEERIGSHREVEPVVLSGATGRAITEFAENVNADCIIVGSHKPGLSDYFLGSTASRVVRHAPCAVHVLR